MSAVTTRVCRLYGKGDIRIERDPVAALEDGQVLVRIGAGGICGSDLHYFQDGGFGPIRVREPIILGHEVAGTVEALGSAVAGLRVGQKVALNPSRPCHQCRYCRESLFQHCLNMRFYGSALRFPHEQGGFRDVIVADAAQCMPVGDHVTLGEAACAEPLAVCLHARSQTDDLAGSRVLVTGAGPIGLLCVAVVRLASAAEIVVTDLQDATLAVARRMGATRTINMLNEAEALESYNADKGTFDVAFECSAAAPAIKAAVLAVRPRGVIVQAGVAGDTAVPLNLLVGKEIAFRGTHRFHAEYAEAVRLIDSGAIDVKPLITHTLPLAEAAQAFAIAGDRSKAVKVQLAFV
ncbi:L-idonate 5-dehydrogenase [Rhizobium sp. TRM95111]|uniref:L-idonate 5-dehydrogenase n=1 Tax=Rhizobium alarense TaxID=2846851 RepID=UPI001F3DDB96|nr:L-idonate 5-dehydrogenase [Rhizobium alarense]MCF3640269.1 L-idonate 5-dehydrogenase [Rhizobium alarense]